MKPRTPASAGAISGPPGVTAPTHEEIVTALEAAESVMAAREFASLVALEGVEPPTEAEWSAALKRVRQVLKALDAE